MIRKISLELDAAQRKIAESGLQHGFVKGCLDRAYAYLTFARSDGRLRGLTNGWMEELVAIQALLADDAPERTLFASINALYHQLAQQANMPVGEHHFCIRTNDKADKETEFFPCISVLDNLRSAFNVGTIIRTSDGFGVEEVVFSGITATLENKHVRKTSMGSHEYVPCRQEDDLQKLLEQYKSSGRTVYALETVENSSSLFEVEFQFPMAMVVGNEEFGILEDRLSQVDQIIYIPMYGRKNSFNVGVSYGMVMCEARKQWEMRATH